MIKKRLLTLLCALFLLIAVFPFSVFATDRTDSMISFNGETNLIVNGTSTSYGATSNGTETLTFNFIDMTWTSRYHDGTSSTKTDNDSVWVELVVDYDEAVIGDGTVSSVTVDYYCDYLDPGGVSRRYSVNPDVVDRGTFFLISCEIPIIDLSFIQDIENDYSFVLNVHVTTTSTGGGSTPGTGTTPSNVAYVFDELVVYVDGVAVTDWSVSAPQNSVLVRKADGSYAWKLSDGVYSGLYTGTQDITFSLIPGAAYADHNFVLSSGTYRYWDANSTSDQYSVPVSYDSESNTGSITWHYVEGTVGHGIMTLNFTSTESSTPTYSITSEGAGFEYNANTKTPYTTQLVADGQGEFTLYALPYNGKYPRYAEIYNSSNKLLSRIDMTTFDDTAFYCLLPDYGEKCRVTVVYSDEVNSDYTNGYNAGYQQGLKDGADDGSYNEGYDAGYFAGLQAAENTDGWLDFFDGVFGSLIFNAVYVLAGIGFGDISLLDVIVIGFFAFVLVFVIKKLVN